MCLRDNDGSDTQMILRVVRRVSSTGSLENQRQNEKGTRDFLERNRQHTLTRVLKIFPVVLISIVVHSNSVFIKGRDLKDRKTKG